MKLIKHKMLGVFGILFSSNAFAGKARSVAVTANACSTKLSEQIETLLSKVFMGRGIQCNSLRSIITPLADYNADSLRNQLSNSGVDMLVAIDACNATLQQRVAGTETGTYGFLKPVFKGVSDFGDSSGMSTKNAYAINEYRRNTEAQNMVYTINEGYVVLTPAPGNRIAGALFARDSANESDIAEGFVSSLMSNGMLACSSSG